MPKPLCLVDTSILLNILNVPGKNERQDEVFAAFEEKVEAGETFSSLWRPSSRPAIISAICRTVMIVTAMPVPWCNR